MRPVPGTITDPAVTRALFPEHDFERDLVNLARALAKVAHRGQTRRGSGEPYFNHVQRVALNPALTTARQRALGYLHDLIEDTLVDYQTLRYIGVPSAMVADLVTLTRRYYPAETYEEYITRLIEEGSDDALQVKLADLEHNLNDTEGQIDSQRARYIRADIEIRRELKRRAAAA